MTTATIYNAKARVRQDLTLTAESIMETFKGYDLESLVGMFGEPQIDGESGELIFAKDNIEQNNKNYTATITLNPTVQSEVLTLKNAQLLNDAIYQSNEKDYSDEQGSIENALFVEAFEAKDYEDFYNNFILKPYDGVDSDKYYTNADVMIDDGNGGVKITSAEDIKIDEIKNYVEVYDRTITFDIGKEGDNYIVKESMVYRYYIKNFEYYTAKYYTVTDSLLNEDVIDETAYLGQHHVATYPVDEKDYYEYKVENTDIYSGSDEIDRLFIYYFPQYDLEAGKDKIIINCDLEGTEFDCYIIKQKSDYNAETRTNQGEGKYLPNIVCNNTKNAEIYLYHNFDTNISDTKGSSKLATHNLTGLSGFTKTYGLSDMSDKLAKQITSEETDSDLISKEVLSYDITVTITDESGNVVSELTSSKNERINEDESDTDSMSED
jgi:hypothetical protein